MTKHKRFKHIILTIVISALTLNAVLDAEALRPVSLSECMPDARDYTFMWWAHGYRGTPARQEKIVCIQTGYYGLALDVEKIRLPNLGLIKQPGSMEEAVSQNNKVIWDLPQAQLTLAVWVEGVKHACVGSEYIKENTMIGPTDSRFRIIDSGRFAQRADVVGLVFKDEKNNELKAQGRLEIVAWPDRLTLLFELTPQKNYNKVRLEIALDQKEMVATPHPTFSKEIDIRSGHNLQATMVLTSRSNETLVPKTAVLVKELKSGHPLVIGSDIKLGSHVIKLPDQDFDSKRLSQGKYADQMDRYKLQLFNPHREAVRQRIQIAADYCEPGRILLLRDGQGNPSGIPIQISKNWHRGQKKLLYEGSWYHGYSLLNVPAHSQLECEITFIDSYWGGLPAVSHAQLSLIGWGVNQLWDEVAIGNWGESICYDPDVNLNRSMIDDIRPLMVWPMKNQTGTFL